MNFNLWQTFSFKTSVSFESSLFISEQATDSFFPALVCALHISEADFNTGFLSNVRQSGMIFHITEKERMALTWRGGEDWTRDWWPTERLKWEETDLLATLQTVLGQHTAQCLYRFILTSVHLWTLSLAILSPVSVSCNFLLFLVS